MAMMLGGALGVPKKSGAWAEAEFSKRYQKIFPGTTISPKGLTGPSPEVGFDYKITPSTLRSNPLFIEVKLKAGTKIRLSEAQLEKIRDNPTIYHIVVVDKSGDFWLCEQPYKWVEAVFGSFPNRLSGHLYIRLDLNPPHWSGPKQ